MLKSFYSFTFCLFLFFVAGYSIYPQTYDKTKYKDQSENDAGFDEPYHMGKYSKRELNSTSTNWQKPMTLSLDEPVQFPYQDMYGYYLESFPVLLANGQILMVWHDLDTLKCAHSNDGGLTWGVPMEINSGGDWPIQISGVRTTSDRVVAVWKESAGLWMSYSDDNGFNWSAPASITNDGRDGNTTITQTLDGKLWLFYSRFDPSTQSDIYYRTSTDDGLNWSSEQTFAETNSDEYYGTVVSGTGSTLLAFYVDDINGNWDIYLKTSNDGGTTWSTYTPIVNSSSREFRPRVLRQSNGDLWMIYYRNNPTPILQGFGQWEIYYTQSFDGGNNWTTPTQFTQYVDYDGIINADLVNDQPFVSFTSERWAPTIGQRQLWYGLIGTTQDLDPPPAVFFSTPINVAANVPIYVQAFVDDENAVSDVQMFYSVNGTPFGPVQMFDDGLHNDENPGDNIWSEVIGSFQLGDVISYSFSVTDITNNTVNVDVGSFDIPPIHDIGNVILNFRPNSRLADEGNSPGTNAYWPSVNGDDYLFSGGLWIGLNGLGDYRVMDATNGYADWKRTDGSAITLGPGISDQDVDVTYDDHSTSPLIGLQVHQESYQWSDPTRDDFIIFQYTIKNTGENGDLLDLFTAVWTDPDLIDANDDLGGYDSQRDLIYLYDSQGIPSGYIGLKLLGGNMPSTAVIEKPLGYDDFAKFNYMTSGFTTLPTDPNDYDMLLTAQPFDLADGETNILAFGLVMGGSLAELQENADTMEAIYNIIVSVEDFTSDIIPTEFSLAQNYPNPFNPSTNIKYSVPETGSIKLSIYSVIGEEVAVLVDGIVQAGFYEITFDASNLPSGAYFYRLQSDNNVEAKKMLLMK